MGDKTALPPNLDRAVERLVDRDGRYAKDAYMFLYEALNYTVKSLGKAGLPDDQRHVSGADLLKGISEFGLSRFGPLTRTVFEHWGVHETEDFGNIVFNLVSARLMGKTEKDCIEDFIDVYDFASEFDWNKRRAEFRK